jgi:hypothetical protein
LASNATRLVAVLGTESLDDAPARFAGVGSEILPFLGKL